MHQHNSMHNSIDILLLDLLDLQIDWFLGY
jgi:hypothetical protein